MARPPKSTRSATASGPCPALGHWLTCLLTVGWLAAGWMARGAINPMRLGAHYESEGSQISFRVYSARATRVEVYLYDTPTGAGETAHYEMARDMDGVWSAVVAASTPAGTNGRSATVYYGYRAWGPNWPYDPAWRPGSAAGFISDVDTEGNRFDPNKLLLDPYALEVSHDPITPSHRDRSVYASGARFRDLDSAPYAPKGIVLPVPGTGEAITGKKPETALKDDIIYEVHLRGFTKADPLIPENVRGTYAGAALKAPYLAGLGVTTVEFQPVQETQNDANDAESGRAGNYWGYATLNYFAPDRRYASDKSPGGPTREFQAMVKAWHDLGIKVFIDVVYNHTGEGSTWRGDKTTCDLLSWRGLDNPTYYSLSRDRQGYWDNTGCGGNFNTFNRVAQNLIVDSLAHWRDTMGVDGFRFDLAPVLGNTIEHGGFHYDRLNRSNALNRITAEFPPRPGGGGSGTDFIAEPWAIGGNSYQVGGLPDVWSEWNGKYRDTIRRAQNGGPTDKPMPATIAARLIGSPDLYRRSGRKPWNSINFIVAHDGFTLIDLYSYNAKQNSRPWPYGPSDGGENSNISWNQGGDARAQRQAARTGFALLMLSAGTPMMTGGDEFLRSLRGNNNPYDLDTVANWLNYTLDPDQSAFRVFAQRMIAFRRAHPALRPVDFYSGRDGVGTAQLQWFRPDGRPAEGDYLADPKNQALAWRLDGAAFNDPSPALYIAWNWSPQDITFHLPPAGGGLKWHLVTDTSSRNEGPDTVAAPGQEKPVGGESATYPLTGRALALFIAK